MSSRDLKRWLVKEVVSEVLSSLEIVSHTTGGKVMYYLVNNVCKVYPYYFLEHISEKDDVIDDNVDVEAMQTASQDAMRSSIEMCDLRTKFEVQKRLNFLISMINAKQGEHDKTNLYDLEVERDKLMVYLAEVLRPDGRIRTFADNLKRARTNVLRNTRRYLSELESYNPELVNHLRRCIHKSVNGMVYWDNPDSIPWVMVVRS